MGIHPNHDAVVRQREKQKDGAIRHLLKQRGAIVEPVAFLSKAIASKHSATLSFIRTVL